MVAFRLRQIVERKYDKSLRRIEVLSCGHIHVMSKHEKIGFKQLGKFDAYLTSRQCRECAEEEADA